MGLATYANADVCNVIGFHRGNEYNGPTTCGQGTENGINVNGPLMTTGTSFTGPVQVKGPVKATDTRFSSGISIASNTITFASTSSPNVEMKKTGDEYQVVYLTQGSAVTNVIFDNANSKNKVCLSGGASVAKVSGGQMVNNC